MELKVSLTNEKVSKKFKSQFDLVNYAIRLAENMIRTGRDSRVKIDSQNRALQVLGEIVCDKDQFDEIPVEEFEVDVAEPRRFERRYEEPKQNSSAKYSERKKTRKILVE